MSKFPNSGILSPNDRKEKQTHADWRGKCEIDGVEYWLDGWIKQGQRGEFISLSFKRKEARTGPTPVARDMRPFVDDSAIPSDAERVQRVKQGVAQHFGGLDDDSIPFAPEVRG